MRIALSSGEPKSAAHMADRLVGCLTCPPGRSPASVSPSTPRLMPSSASPPCKQACASPLSAAVPQQPAWSAARRSHATLSQREWRAHSLAMSMCGVTTESTQPSKQGWAARSSRKSAASPKPSYDEMEMRTVVSHGSTCDQGARGERQAAEGRRRGRGHLEESRIREDQTQSVGELAL